MGQVADSGEGRRNIILKVVVLYSLLLTIGMVVVSWFILNRIEEMEILIKNQQSVGNGESMSFE